MRKIPFTAVFRSRLASRILARPKKSVEAHRLTKRIFKRCGLHLYNEHILLNAYGTAPMRARQFERTRKAVKVHQNVLVFYKGDTKAIRDIYGDSFEFVDLSKYENRGIA